MPHGHTIFPSKGKCIYCHKIGVDLTDEHILPYSLGGQHIIAKASCAECQVVTSKIERAVAKGLWEEARIAYDAPSYRKKNRPSHVTIPATKSGETPIILPFDEYPAAMVFYWMTPAGLLQGLPPDFDLSKTWTMKVVTDDAKREAFLAKYPGRLVVKFRHEPENFARLLAKVAYCQVLTMFDLDDFEQICVPYILGKKVNPSFVVGSAVESQLKMSVGYFLAVRAFGTIDRIVICAELKLYANLETPTYHVVVGQVVGVHAVQKAFEKMKLSGAVDVAPMQSAPNIMNAKVEHWASNHWPPKFWPS